MIKKEAPIGSDVAAVDAMLTAHEIPHSAYQQGLDQSNIDNKREKLQGIVSGHIVALKKDVAWGWMVRWHLAMRFYYDEQGKLIDYTVKMIGTGP